MTSVGIVGWRGMVGSVLLDRMRTEGDFELIDSTFFSTSQVGQQGPDVGAGRQPLADANDPKAFAGCDIVICCQGGEYTKSMHPRLRAAGWGGYWLDAASALRLKPNSVIVLDPVNRATVDRSLDAGLKDFIGGNCTVSLMLMAMSSLIDKQWVEWVNVATYQAASGSGAAHMRELVAQMRHFSGGASADLSDPAMDILELDRRVRTSMSDEDAPLAAWGVPLAASLIPWCGGLTESGQTDEERKGQAETNKILGLSPSIPVDGVCVRVGAMRSHSQALTIKLTQDVPLDEIEDVLASAHEWVSVVPNTKDATINALSPAAVSGSLQIPIGRLRKLSMGPEYLSAFTVGDQLLWGAAEPVRRMLRILLERD